MDSNDVFCDIVQPFVDAPVTNVEFFYWNGRFFNRKQCWKNGHFYENCSTNQQSHCDLLWLVGGRGQRWRTFSPTTRAHKAAQQRHTSICPASRCVLRLLHAVFIPFCTVLMLFYAVLLLFYAVLVLFYAVFIPFWCCFMLFCYCFATVFNAKNDEFDRSFCKGFCSHGCWWTLLWKKILREILTKILKGWICYQKRWIFHLKSMAFFIDYERFWEGLWQRDIVRERDCAWERLSVTGYLSERHAEPPAKAR